MKRTIRIIAKAGLWFAAFSFAAFAPAASVIYSNFAPASSYDITQGNPVGNAFDGNDYAEGDTFLLGGNATFSSVRIALSCFAFCSDPFSVILARDAGNEPGAPIETFTVSPASLGALGANNPPLVLNSVINPVLMAGTRYWIVVTADLNDSIDWNLNLSHDSSAEAISLDGGATWFSPSGSTPGAFEIDAIIPEPGSAGLLASAGLLLLFLGAFARARMR